MKACVMIMLAYSPNIINLKVTKWYVECSVKFFVHFR